MTESKEDKLEQLVRTMDSQSRLVGAWHLQGGVSAQVIAIETIRSDGQTKKMIVRKHAAADLEQNPHVAADEFKLLQILKSAGLPTPAVYYLDQSGEIFSTPFLVMEFIEGQTEFAPSNLTDFILQMATVLAKIHSVDYSKLELSFLPNQAEIYAEKLARRPANLDEALSEGLIRDTLESVWPLPQRNPDVLLHGDFWPGNTLWKDGHLVAVIDWEDAALGVPLMDLANGRLEVLWAFGTDAMEEFTLRYQSLMTTIDFTNLPYWDLCAALRPASRISEWGLDESTEKRMRVRHKWFVSQALGKLSPSDRGGTT